MAATPARLGRAAALLTCTLSVPVLLAGCGQKGPLFLPAAAAARPVAATPAPLPAAADRLSTRPQAGSTSASSPGVPSGVVPGP